MTSRRIRPIALAYPAGQTLIEVSVAIAVLAVVTSIGLPWLGDALARQALVTAASRWQGAHALARSHAILRGVPTVLCPSDDVETCRQQTSWENGFILFEDPNRNRVRDPGERVIRAFDGDSRTRMNTSTGRRAVAFQPTGRTDGSNVTMTICPRFPARVEGRRLITSNSGRLRVEPIPCDP